MLLEKKDIDQLDRIYRINLINSLSGIKPANLIGTRSKDEIDNLAIFSSVVHLGSNPAQFGMVMRPQTEIPKDTYRNISESGFYTINHISEDFIKNAHYTSAKFEADESEFDKVNINKEFINDFYAPFVSASEVKLGMKHLTSLNLPNGCIFIIGEVQQISIGDEYISEEGYVNLDDYNHVGIGGLNNYYALNKKASFPYARVNEIPDFNA